MPTLDPATRRDHLRRPAPFPPRVAPVAVIALAALAALLAELAAAPPARPVPGRTPGLQVGDPAPEATLETLDGDHIWISRLKGKVVLLDFWATWCGPCVSALPGLRALTQEHRGDSFLLLSISGDANGRRLREFVENRRLGWTQCWDGNAEAQRLYRVRGFPTYFLIDAEGRIRYVAVGWDRRVERELRRAVGEAIAESGGAVHQAAGAGRR